MTTIIRQCKINGKVRELHFTQHGHNVFAVRNGGKHWMRIRQIAFRPQTVRYRNGGKATLDAGTWVAEHMIQGRLASEGVVAVDYNSPKKAFVLGCEHVWGDYVA